MITTTLLLLLLLLMLLLGCPRRLLVLSQVVTLGRKFCLHRESSKPRWARQNATMTRAAFARRISEERRKTP